MAVLPEKVLAESGEYIPAFVDSDPTLSVLLEQVSTEGVVSDDSNRILLTDTAFPTREFRCTPKGIH